MTRPFDWMLDTFSPQSAIGVIGVVFAAISGLTLAVLISIIVDKWVVLSFFAIWFSAWGLIQSVFCIAVQYFNE